MKKIIIITDSCADLEQSLREKYDIDYIKLHLTRDDGKEYFATNDFEDFSAKEFYDSMRQGRRYITSQLIAPVYEEVFEKHLKDGNDILYIGCSSALSNSINNSFKVRNELLKKYPDSKIICIDSLRACYALGILVLTAAEMRDEGKSIEEIGEWIENHKLEAHQIGTPDSLIYLKKAGRVNAAAAVFGGVLNIKPIIIADAIGQNTSIEKTKGRKNSLIRIAELVAENYESVPYQKLFIGNADCLEDAETLKQEILNRIPDKKIDVHFGYVGPIVGASCGPGMISAYFFGKKVTHVGK